MTEIQSPQPAPLPKGWRLQTVSEGDIRMYSPTGETWLLRANTNEDFYDFIHGFLSDLMAAVPAPEGAQAPSENLLIGQAQHLIGALMNHGLLPKTADEERYLKLWDVVKAQLRCVHREAVRAALAAQPQAPVPLTTEQKRAMWMASDFRGNGGQIDWYVKGIEDAERVHRITQTKEPTNDR